MTETSGLLQQAAQLHQSGALAEAERRYADVLTADPANAEALYRLGVLACQTDRFDAGTDYFRRSLAVDPKQPRALNLLGMALSRRGLPDEALASFDKAIAIGPDFPDAHGNRADLLAAMGRHADAVASYDRAVSLRPDSPEDWCNRGTSLKQIGRHSDALASFDRAIALHGNFVEALLNRASILADLKRHDDALAGFDRVLALQPGRPDVLASRGTVLQKLERHADALAAFDNALSKMPRSIETLNQRGITLSKLKREDEAIASYRAALAIDPHDVVTLNNYALSLGALQRIDEATATYQRALAIKPDFVDALVNLGDLLAHSPQPADAFPYYDRAIAIKQDHVNARVGRAALYAWRARYQDAMTDLDNILKKEPDHELALGVLALCHLATCRWDRLDELREALTRHVREGRANVSPLTLVLLGASPADQLACARAFIRERMPPDGMPLVPAAPRQYDKIRLAYVSPDFRTHPVGLTIVDLLERHDRSRFEVRAISTGADEKSAIRERITRSADYFHDVSRHSDRAIAELLASNKVDIAIDLCGHTEGARSGIFAHRPAPVQVSYHGYAGTTGAEFIDYVLADRISLPAEQQPFYTESIVHLPDCYFVSDSKRPVLQPPERAAAGLPDKAFVFCCFNNNAKLSPSIFDRWMRLLKKTPDGIIWLSRANPLTVSHLQDTARASGIDPSRVIFAPRTDRLEDHLARIALADLFLDTIPYNAHATASEALWASVPVLTCMGDGFAGRVAASMLHAAGLPELVTHSLDEYENLAGTFAADRNLLKPLRDRLASGRHTRPLFDTARLCRHIEAAYETMCATWQRGEKPRGFAVPVPAVNGPRP